MDEDQNNPEKLNESEESKENPEPEEKDSDFNYSDKDDTSKLSNLTQRIKNNRKKLLIGGMAGGGLVGLIIVAIMAIIPLKIETIIKNLENHYFASGNSAVSSETNTLLKEYFVKYVGPSLKGCSKDGKTVIDFNCSIIPITGNGKNPVVNLYKNYKQAKIQNYLAEHGFELKYDPVKNGGTYYLKTPDMTGKGEVVPEDANHNITFEGFSEVASKNEIRKAAMSSIEEDVTLWKKVMLRYKIGKFLEEKFGIKRCLVFCGVKDFFSDTPSKAIYASKVFLIDRVINPHSETAATIVKCIILNSGCGTKKEPATTCADSSSCGEVEGEATDAAANTEDAILATASDEVLSSTSSKILSEIGDFKDKGFNQYVINKIITSITGKESSVEVPGIGELQTVGMVASLVQGLKKSPTYIKRATYLANSAAAVALFTNYLTFADEIHTGHVNAQEVGSMVNSLGSGNQCQAAIEGNCNPSNQLGGTAGADQTPLYSNIMTNTTGGSPSYTCRNGSQVPSGSLVCPEENLSGHNKYVSEFSNYLNQTGLAGLATAWNDTVGVAMKPVNYLTGLLGKVVSFAFNHTPGVSSVMSWVSKNVGNIIKNIMNYLVPSPFGPDMSGGRTFDMMAAGADVSGNTYAHNGLGGQMLSPQQVATIQDKTTKLAEAQFAEEPLLYRLFSTSSAYSLISRFAMNIPLTTSTTMFQDFLHYFDNPISGIIGNIGSVLDGRINALPGPQTDPFSVVQYGYTQSDLNAIGDPETYWNNNCNNNPADGYQNNNAYYNEASNQVTGDPNGSFINQTTDPCELIMTTVGSDGAVFNSSLLTKDEQTQVNGNSSSSSSTTTTSSSYQNPFRAIVNLVPGRIDQGVDFTGTGPIYAIGDATVNGVYQNWYQNEPLIAYTLTDGPAQGKIVYVAECITPNVQAGQTITSNTVIAQMTNCGNGIETGWANSSNLPDSMALNCWDSVSSSFGVNFSQFLQSIGVPAGVSQEPNPPCTLPQGWPTW